MKGGGERTRIVLPPLELVLVKQATPFPSIQTKILGADIKFPISDDTLCMAAALLLGKTCPIYL